MMDFVDFKTLKRPRSPNTHLLAPRDLCEQTKPDRISETLPISPDQLFDGLLKLIDARADWHLEDQDKDRRLIRFVAVTRLMRYKDDVDILVMPAEAADPDARKGARLAIYSRSRVGHSDMGANKKRVSQLLERLKGVQVGT
ncbi:MAG: DUF1499 domain-containing protein [Pseudomonadota bacterium]